MKPTPMLVCQHAFTLPAAFGRGLQRSVTRELSDALEEQMAWCRAGTLHLFLQEATASITVDRDARADINPFAPAEATQQAGSSVTLPVTAGKINLGVGQDIWLCEHAGDGGSRKFVATIAGAQ